MSTRTFSFSTLINKQTSVFPALDDADVILERRDAENLVLMRSERFEALADGLRLAARSLSVVARANRSLAEEVFSEELPWLTWLPAEARPECIRELLDHLLAGADTGLLIPFARALREWKSTAEIYSDPDLALRLRGPFDTSAAVELPRPGAVTTYRAKHRLKFDLKAVKIDGVEMEQWQYEVSGGGRIWFAIDDEKRVLWITQAGTGHPKQTDRRRG